MTEPFVTLSSESTSESTSGSESFDNPTPLSTPPATTHDTSRASFHVRDLEQFAKDLQNAADRAFPNQGRSTARYRDVSVLLLRWEDDEMNVDWELEDLEKVFKKYGFGTERWLIPRKNSHLKLMSKAIEVVEEHDDDGNLVIIYYAGHALINSSRQATWSCKSDVRYASLEWSAIQTLFEKANMDVLLLLDCCAAASAAPTVGSAVTETIAACGFENIAPQPGRHSFTNSLIEVLEDWIDAPPFSAAMLHNKVLSVLKHEQPERAQNGKRRKVECRRTPIHIMGTADPKLPSIELGRRISVLSPPPANPEIEVSVTPCPTVPSRVAYEPESLNKETENGFDVPRVIISLSLEHDQNLNSETCKKWLTSCPALIKHAKVEAVYKSFSVLVLLSVPVLIWDLLPEHPACSFVGFATSSNLLMGNSTKNPGVESMSVNVSDGSNIIYPPCGECRKKNIRWDEAAPLKGAWKASGKEEVQIVGHHFKENPKTRYATIFSEPENFHPPPRTDIVSKWTKRPVIKVLIPAEQPEDKSGSPQSAKNASKAQPNNHPQDYSPSRSRVVLPPLSPTASAEFPAIASGTVPRHTSREAQDVESSHMDTPISALASSFYPDWNFNYSDSITLPSPLNFATPAIDSGPNFLREDSDGLVDQGMKRKWQEG